MRQETELDFKRLTIQRLYQTHTDTQSEYIYASIPKNDTKRNIFKDEIKYKKREILLKGIYVYPYPLLDHILVGVIYKKIYIKYISW